MRIHSIKKKQVKNGVYYLKYGGEISVADYHYSIPQKSVVIPDKNMVLICLHKGNYVWQYVQAKSIWTMRYFSQGITGSILDMIKHTPFDLVVEKHDDNKAFVRMPTFSEGKRQMKSEWRYYTYFFNDLVRKETTPG